MATIPRNAHRKIARIFDQATGAWNYSLDGGFKGQEISIDQARRLWDEPMGCKPKFEDAGGGKFKIRFHSNHWVEIRSEVGQ